MMVTTEAEARSTPSACATHLARPDAEGIERRHVEEGARRRQAPADQHGREAWHSGGVAERRQRQRPGLGEAELGQGDRQPPDDDEEDQLADGAERHPRAMAGGLCARVRHR